MNSSHYRLLTNDRSRLFWFGNFTYPILLDNARIVRLMWGGGPAKNSIILGVRLPDKHEFIERPHGYLDVVYAECVDPTRYDPHGLIFRLSDLQVRQRWIKRLTAGPEHEREAIDTLMHIDCKVLRVTKDG